jgi:hypothetical protein
MEDGHRLWRFVIYRRTYKDDEKWNIFTGCFHIDME